jgi:glycosyltransferase involved in cell wall biosynthesis
VHDLKVCYDAERGVERWLRRGSADGQVPDLWPYGLNQFADLGVDVVHKDNAPLSAGEEIRQLIAPTTSTRTGDPTARVSIAWDEGAAKRLLMRDRSERNHCGAIWVNDMIKRTDPPLVWAATRVLRQMDSIFVNSRAQVDPLEQMLPGVRVDFVHFGIDAEFFTPTPYPDAQTVVSLGVDRHRDPDVLFRALDRVRDSHQHSEFLIQSRATETPDWLELVPMMSATEVRDLYARSAVVVVSTTHNVHVSGVTVAMEAMASGRPVVITHTPGLEDYVIDGVTGTMVAEGDDRGLAQAIGRYLDDPALAAEHGHNGRRRVEELLNTRRMVGDLYRVLELDRVLGSS